MDGPDWEKQTDQALREWRQGDAILHDDVTLVHVADLTRPITAAAKAAQDEGEEDSWASLYTSAKGLVVLSQSCDITRACSVRPYIEVAALEAADSAFVEEVRRGKRPNFAFVPGVATQNLVARLDRTMTIEKSAVLQFKRTLGCRTDEEVRVFSDAVARFKSRFAFPDDFVLYANAFQKRMKAKHGKASSEGAHLDALLEIRVQALPSWNADKVSLKFLFVREFEPTGFESNWFEWIDEWMKLLAGNAKYRVLEALVVWLEDISAADYVDSDRLDLDQLSA